jgi:hypothetical protein
VRPFGFWQRAGDEPARDAVGFHISLRRDSHRCRLHAVLLERFPLKAAAIYPRGHVRVTTQLYIPAYHS